MKSATHAPVLSGAHARVARTLLESGPQTASALCLKLHLTGTAIRRHLDTLVDAGYAEAHDRAPFGPTKPRGRGRPARIYSLTSSGRDAFDQAYDDLAIAALRHMADTGGEAQVAAFAQKRAGDMERRYAVEVAQAQGPADKAQALADALDRDGFAAGTQQAGEVGIQVCQHHCPVAHVAQEFPQLCDAETEAFARLLGTHVTRLATLSHGDGVCTTHVAFNNKTASNSATNPRPATSVPRNASSERTSV